MGLGLKVLVIMFVLCGFGAAIVILPANSHTAGVYNCFVTTRECQETRDPIDLMIKMGMMPALPGYA